MPCELAIKADHYKLCVGQLIEVIFRTPFILGHSSPLQSSFMGQRWCGRVCTPFSPLKYNPVHRSLFISTPPPSLPLKSTMAMLDLVTWTGHRIDRRSAVRSLFVGSMNVMVIVWKKRGRFQLQPTQESSKTPIGINECLMTDTSCEQSTYYNYQCLWTHLGHR